MVEIVVSLIMNFLLGGGCLAAVGWLVINQDLMSLDGLFVAITCLVLSLIFFLNCYWNLRSEEFSRFIQRDNEGIEK
ncbi:MAG: hypothetical protein MK025_04280 [Acidobacteriia bacterium]|nr:hypothetical protein [Terriglobia bacterium]